MKCCNFVNETLASYFRSSTDILNNFLIRASGFSNEELVVIVLNCRDILTIEELTFAFNDVLTAIGSGPPAIVFTPDLFNAFLANCEAFTTALVNGNLALATVILNGIIAPFGFSPVVLTTQAQGIPVLNFCSLLTEMFEAINNILVVLGVPPVLTVTAELLAGIEVICMLSFETGPLTPEQQAAIAAILNSLSSGAGTAFLARTTALTVRYQILFSQFNLINAIVLGTFSQILYENDECCESKTNRARNVSINFLNLIISTLGNLDLDLLTLNLLLGNYIKQLRVAIGSLF